MATTAKPDGVSVTSGTSFSDGVLSPMVLIVVNKGPEEITLPMRPAAARRIGLDLLAASMSAITDTGVRRFAKRAGFDGDTLVGDIAEVVADVLAEEDK